MKKIMLGCLCLLGTLFLFNSCSKDKDDETSASSSSTAGSNSTTSNGNNSSNSGSSGSSSTTTDTVVLINGVKWATRNVATPGTFATNSYDAGMFYQWNSKVGWPAIGEIGSITATDGSRTWNNSWKGGYTKSSAFDTWKTANDPSPMGWRIPTLYEIKTLLDSTKVTSMWTTQNGVYGEKFTDKNTGSSIFLPASGCRVRYDYYGLKNSAGVLSNGGSRGYYWCSTLDSSDYTCYLDFYSSYVGWFLNCRANGLAIRPVLK